MDTHTLLNNELALYLPYGLVFILMGFAIALQYKKLSTLQLASKMWLLATFAIIHGLGEWFHGYVHFLTSYVNVGNVIIYQVIEKFLISSSFAFLLAFGIEIFVGIKGRYYWLRWAPVLLFVIWFGYFFMNHNFSGGPQCRQWLNNSLIFARYSMAFPGSLLTSYVLFVQRQKLKYFGLPYSNLILMSSAGFLIYAFVAGILVPYAPFFPAKYINVRSFENYLGFPPQILRLFAVLVVTVTLIRFLQIFNIEYHKRIEKAEKYQAICAERERISKDLHDGILQSLYSIGLRLEYMKILTRDKADQPEYEHLIYSLEKLNEVMGDIRHFIKNLCTPNLTKKIDELIKDLVWDFERYSAIKAELEMVEPLTAELTYRQINNLYLVIKEALSNITKHAEATRVEVKVWEDEETLYITIKDNGVGFNPDNVYSSKSDPSQHFGLKNMADRMRGINGSLAINSVEGQGTEINLKIKKGEPD